MKHNMKVDNMFFLKAVVILLLNIVSCSLYADIIVDKVSAEEIVERLHDKYTQKRVVLFPNSPETGDIIIADKIRWNSDNNLVIQSRKDIIFRQGGKIVSEGNGSIFLKAGMSSGDNFDGKGIVVFEGEEPQIELKQNGKVRIYYNPQGSGVRHKYHSGKAYTFSKNIKAKNKSKALNTYMLVNNVRDLQDINLFLSGNYALSQDIDASDTRIWENGRGFDPLRDTIKNMPFSGNFDGNGYTIRGLFINRPDEDKVGLFGTCSGVEHRPNTIENLILSEFNVTGDHYVGSLAGWATHTNIFNVSVSDSSIVSRDVAGGVVGTSYDLKLCAIINWKNHGLKIEANEYKGLILGTANKSKINTILIVSDQNEYESKPLNDYYIGFDNKSSMASEVITLSDFKKRNMYGPVAK